MVYIQSTGGVGLSNKPKTNAVWSAVRVQYIWLICVTHTHAHICTLLWHCRAKKTVVHVKRFALNLVSLCAWPALVVLSALRWCVQISCIACVTYVAWSWKLGFNLQYQWSFDHPFTLTGCEYGYRDINMEYTMHGKPAVTWVHYTMRAQLTNTLLFVL